MELVQEDQRWLKVPEVLNSFNVPGNPPHKLKLKEGAVVTVMRNLSMEGGLVNGTRYFPFLSLSLP